MILLIFITFVLVELTAIIGLIFLCIMLKDLNEEILKLEKPIMNTLINLKEDLKVIKSKIKFKEVKPMTQNEIIKMISKVFMKSIKKGRLPIIELIITLLKNKQRILKTINVYRET